MSEYKSSTGWEVSKFGGYRNLLLDFPHITVNWNIGWDLPSDIMKERNDISSFSGDKLAKIFLLKVKEHGCYKTFTTNLVKETEEQEKERKRFSFGFNKKTRYYVDRKKLGDCLSSVTVCEEELKNLFIHYFPVLKNTLFYIDVEESKDKEDEGNKSETESEEQTEEIKKGKELEQNQKASRKFEDLIGDIKKEESRKYFYNENLGGDLVKKTKFFSVPIGRACEYTYEETIAANQLINLLDISFEKQEDVVQNLRSGKLDTAKLAEIASGTTTIYYNVEEDQTTRPFSVCILADESGSMNDGVKIKMQKSVLKILYKAFSQILPLDKIFIYGHTGGSTPDIYTYHDKYSPNFEETIDEQDDRMYGENYDGPVIESIYNKIRTFTSDNIIFISLSDGQPSGYHYGGLPAMNDMKRIIEKCKRDGFVTIGIGMQYGEVAYIYNYNAVIHNMHGDEMVKKVSLLINKVVKTEFQN